MNVAVIGGGAAGFFAALSAKAQHPGSSVTIFEKSDKLLAKVRISGGGRCNVCHACFEPRKLAAHYPRGERFLRKAFQAFSTRDTVEWFARQGVLLHTESDGRMFPATNDSATIINALMTGVHRQAVAIRKQCGVQRCMPVEGGGFQLQLTDGRSERVDRVIITAGGHPRTDGYAWIAAMGHSIVPPVPSLFTFNLPGDPIRALPGVVVDPVRLRIIGTDLQIVGPLLITHWGMSGPAVLRLSAWGARILREMGYEATVQVNWLGGRNEDAVRQELVSLHAGLSRKQAINADPFGLPKRFWAHLLERAGIEGDKPWGVIPRKERNRLIDLLTNDRHDLRGKTTFKDEFVTAGGVDLDEVDPMTLQSRIVPGLYFAGEVLDIDGITGGFNFQSAWTTGYLAGKLG